MAEDEKSKVAKFVARQDSEAGPSSTCQTHDHPKTYHRARLSCPSPNDKSDIAAEDSCKGSSTEQERMLEDRNYLSKGTPEEHHVSIVLDQPSPAMETTCEQAESDSLQATVSVANQTRSPDKSKRRQTEHSSPNSRSGSPYSTDSMSSSSLSDRSAFTTPKDTYSNETNENSSSSCEVGSDKEKTTCWSMANFDRVVHDAPKREHIRSRKSMGSRTSQVSKSGFSQSYSGSGSQSRSKPTKVQAAMRNKLHERISETADSGASTSSCSMTHAYFAKKDNFDSNGTVGRNSIDTDTGIATASTSGHSIQYQNNFSISSSSGVDMHLSACKDRKKTPPCKSVGSHYHDIRNASKKEWSEELSEESEGNKSAAHRHQPHSGNHRLQEQGNSKEFASILESKRKRRRFNRTFVLLRHCGLLELTLQTASLMQQSSLMVQQLKSLQQQTGVLYSAIQAMTVNQPTASFDAGTAQKILQNLKEIMDRNGGLSHTRYPAFLNQDARGRVGIKRTSSGETISPDSGNMQSSSALDNSGSFT